MAQATVAYHSQSQNKYNEAVTQALDTRKRALGTIMLNPHPCADEIKRHPRVEVLLVTRDNRAEVMKEVLDRPTER